MVWPAAAVLLLYAGVLLIAVLRGQTDLDCGCHFGPTRQFVSLPLVYRNLFMAALVLCLLLPEESRSLTALDFAGMCFGIVLCVFSYQTLNQLIANGVANRSLAS